MSQNHKSLDNVLQLLLYYIQGHKMTMEQLKSWFNVSDRTIRNYHNILKEYGMDIQLSGGRYSLRCEDNTSIERLLDRLGYLQNTYMGIEKGVETLWSDDNVIKPITKWLKETFKEEYDTAMSKSGPKQKVISLIFKKFGLRQKDYKRGFKRGVYFSSFYKETKEYLQGKEVETLTNRFDSDTKSLVEVWRQRSIKRYLKLVESGRLSSEDLFYTNYLTEETNNIQSKPKVLEVVCKPITKVYDDVIINHNSKSVNYKSQHKSIISSLYHKSFIQTNHKPMIL